MSSGRTLTFGDVHGAARALEQVLERAAYDPANDRLVSLGDLCDGWPEVDLVLDLLRGTPRLDLVLGNHDEWALSWIRTGNPPPGWLEQGGRGTVASYARRAGIDPADLREVVVVAGRAVPKAHRRLLERARPYLIEERPDGRRLLFTHAGWTPGKPPEQQDGYDLRWGRDFWVRARFAGKIDGRHGGDGAGRPPRRLSDFDEVYLGHTPTDWSRPRRVLEVWNLDQGAGWDGVLTLMDVDAHQVWQSDPVPSLYPGVRGRL
jgi:serine/threonine protein phosphatase 1